MWDTLILLFVAAAVCGFFFFIINRDVHRVEKDYYLKLRNKKKAKG